MATAAEGVRHRERAMSKQLEGRRGERDCRNCSCDRGRISPHHPPATPTVPVSRFSVSIQALHRGDDEARNRSTHSISF